MEEAANSTPAQSLRRDRKRRQAPETTILAASTTRPRRQSRSLAAVGAATPVPSAVASRGAAAAAVTPDPVLSMRRVVGDNDDAESREPTPVRSTSSSTPTSPRTRSSNAAVTPQQDDYENADIKPHVIHSSSATSLVPARVHSNEPLVKEESSSFQWPPDMFDESTKIYRILIFHGKNRASDHDKYSRASSLYALQNNCIFKSNWFMPPDLFPSAKAEQASHFFDSTLNFHTYKWENNKRRWNLDSKFATMPAKSLVCVQVPNATGQGHVFFGRICNDTFCVRHNNDLDYWGDTFPLKGDALVCGDNTLMVRHVEWLCWARLRDLPGQDSQCRQVKWLAESSPSCCTELRHKIVALQHLQSQAFLDICSSDFGDLYQEANRVLNGCGENG